MHEEMRDEYKMLAGIPQAKRRVGIFRCRLENNFLIDLTEMGREGVDWTHLTQ
jgi:hypothetical protein